MPNVRRCVLQSPFLPEKFEKNSRGMMRLEGSGTSLQDSTWGEDDPECVGISVMSEHNPCDRIAYDTR